MKLNLFKVMTALVLLLSAQCAHAIITCTITSTGFATAYAPTGVVPNATQGTFNLTCTRGLIIDATTLNYSVAVDNGAQPAGSQNRALLSGGNRINYETYQNSGCNTLWAPATANRITGSMTLTNFTPTTATISYWGCITTANQTVAAGTYTDTISMTARETTLGLTVATNTFPVTITNPATCTVTSIDNVAFGTYVAFRATPLVAPNSNIVLNCTPNLPYSLALDATSGVVSGLNYSLTLSTGSSRGTGPGQTHTISGTMSANQAGTCATGTCAGSDPRTLTITY